MASSEVMPLDAFKTAAVQGWLEVLRIAHVFLPLCE